MTDELRAIPYRRNMSRITPQAANAEPEQERMFNEPESPRAYAARTYTVHAVSPQGFRVALAFADITLETLAAHCERLAELGFTPTGGS